MKIGRRIALALVIILWALPVWAFGPAGAHEILYPANVATGVSTGNILRGDLGAATALLITVEDNSARFCICGNTPVNTLGTSADMGHLITAGQSYLIQGVGNTKNFKIIDAVSGTRSRIHVTVFYGKE